MIPFRWNITKREQLGQLVSYGQVAESYPEFIGDLEICCSRILAFCDNSDLVFIGRSPESIFDYLSGILEKTSWYKRCSLLNLSLRFNSVEEIDRELSGAITAVREQLTELSMSPSQIIHRSRPVAFIDLVASGSTFGVLIDLLLHWARETKLDETALKRKLRFVGITERTKNSPNTWRWQQNVKWAKQFQSSCIKNVSIPWRLWGYLGNSQQKVAQSNPPWRWTDESMAQPPKKASNLAALRLAYSIYLRGCEKDSKLSLAKHLITEPAIKEAWFRQLVQQLKD